MAICIQDIPKFKHIVTSALPRIIIHHGMTISKTYNHKMKKYISKLELNRNEGTYTKCHHNNSSYCL